MKTWMIAGAVAGVILVGALVFGVYFINTMNRSTGLINTITAKQQDNTSEFDNMAKKLIQSAQVTEKQIDSLKEIFVSYANARTGPGGGGSLAKWVTESCPNVDVKTFENLQNILVASRDRWTMRQKELIDLKREHDNMVDMFPSSLVLSLAGHKKQNVVIVTSGRTKEAFASGEDNETKLFDKKAEK